MITRSIDVCHRRNAKGIACHATNEYCNIGGASCAICLRHYLLLFIPKFFISMLGIFFKFQVERSTCPRRKLELYDSIGIALVCRNHKRSNIALVIFRYSSFSNYYPTQFAVNLFLSRWAYSIMQGFLFLYTRCALYWCQVRN